jgi:hypothetical protein
VSLSSDNIKISGTSSSSSSTSTGNQIDNSQDSTSIPSRIMKSRQTSPFTAGSNIDASQDSITLPTPRGSRSIRSKTVRKKSFKMDKLTATNLQIDLSAIPCIAMKSSFSTLKWLRCIEQRYCALVYFQLITERHDNSILLIIFLCTLCRQLKRESQIVWADIDKELLLPYSYSGEKMIDLYYFCITSH